MLELDFFESYINPAQRFLRQRKVVLSPMSSSCFFKWLQPIRMVKKRCGSRYQAPWFEKAVLFFSDMATGACEKAAGLFDLYLF